MWGAPCTLMVRVQGVDKQVLWQVWRKRTPTTCGLGVQKECCRQAVVIDSAWRGACVCLQVPVCMKLVLGKCWWCWQLLAVVC